MKKLTFIPLMFLLIGSISVFGQTTASDEVTLNVRLHPIQTIVINSGQKTVNLDYITTNDYANGVSSDQKNHITIYSTGAFVVKANASSGTLEGTYDEIDASDIRITPTHGSGELANTTFSNINLSNEAQSIISSTTGGVNKTFDIEYAGAGSNSYVNKYFNGENPTVYTTTVLYTIEAQ